jgi:hypothetical protein
MSQKIGKIGLSSAFMGSRPGKGQEPYHDFDSFLWYLSRDKLCAGNYDKSCDSEHVEWARNKVIFWIKKCLLFLSSDLSFALKNLEKYGKVLEKIFNLIFITSSNKKSLA